MGHHYRTSTVTAQLLVRTSGVVVPIESADEDLAAPYVGLHRRVRESVFEQFLLDSPELLMQFAESPNRSFHEVRTQDAEAAGGYQF